MKISVRGDFGKWTEEAKAWFRRAFLQGVLHVEANTVQEAPVREGNLRASASNDVTGESPHMIGTVTVSANYAPFVALGTGIYGPSKKRIVPATAKALKFNAGGKTVFARSTKGMPANPFHERAAEKSLEKLDELFGGVEF